MNYDYLYKQDEGDNKVLKLRFDVSQYAPEEIVVKTVDQKLLVSFNQSDIPYLNIYVYLINPIKILLILL